jgi:putative transposase
MVGFLRVHAEEEVNAGPGIPHSQSYLSQETQVEEIIQAFRMLEVHRTHRAKIRNHRQVADSINRHGWSASKLWNVANCHSREVWEDTGEIPDHGDLKDELKCHSIYKRLHSQSSQRVLEELAEAINVWYEKRKSDSRANPPGYRKKTYYDDQGRRVHEEHPHSTVT